MGIDFLSFSASLVLNTRSLGASLACLVFSYSKNKELLRDDILYNRKMGEKERFCNIKIIKLIMLLETDESHETI